MPAPKPISAHLAEGTFRADRHCQPSKAAATSGDLPRKPNDLDGIASEHWSHVIEFRGSWLAESDGPVLRALCELWSLRQRTLLLLQENPADKLVRTSFQSYHDAWQKLACKFGITPQDRARMGEEIFEPLKVRSRQREAALAEKYLQ